MPESYAPSPSVNFSRAIQFLKLALHHIRFDCLLLAVAALLKRWEVSRNSCRRFAAVLQPQHTVAHSKLPSNDTRTRMSTLLSGIRQIPLMDYLLNRAPGISTSHLLFGLLYLGAHERIQVKKDAAREENAT